MLTDYLFVYGTLKRGGHNHRLLATAAFVGDARTERRFRLIDCGPYPAMLEHADAPLEIRGELYRITASLLPSLDELEDEGKLYRRVTIPIAYVDNAGAGNASVVAWTYLWLGRPDRFPLVPGDAWSIG